MQLYGCRAILITEHTGDVGGHSEVWNRGQIIRLF